MTREDVKDGFDCALVMSPLWASVILGVLALFGVFSSGAQTTLINPSGSDTNYHSIPKAAAFVLVHIDAAEIIDLAKNEGQLTNLVNTLVTSGEMCRVRGHVWQPGCGQPNCLVYHHGETRYCVICGIVQSREMPPWPGEEPNWLKQRTITNWIITNAVQTNLVMTNLLLNP